MLGAALDIFRLRQYFNVITRVREVGSGLLEDPRFAADARRALLPLPLVDRPRPAAEVPFPPLDIRPIEALDGRRIALAATGGSGALASIVGAARAFEEAGVKPAVVSMCSGSAMFGFPYAAGIGPDKVAAFVLALRPGDYLDPDWPALAAALPTAARGLSGLLRGEAVEATYRRLLGEMTLGDLPVPAYAPIWNVEHNRLEYLGPKTHPDVTVARAVRMAIALPLFIQAVALGGKWWSDGGIVDIFPVHPVLDVEGPVDGVVGINGFYPENFEGEDETGWERRPLSILHAAAQVRTCQQIQLARENLARLDRETTVVMIQPVPYKDVRGLGFYRQFLDNRDWAAYMKAGRLDTRRALRTLAARLTAQTGA